MQPTKTSRSTTLGRITGRALAMATLAGMAASGADFQGLGFLPGYYQSEATGVSADGSVVVGLAIGAYPSRALRWAGGTMTSLGTVPGYDHSEAFGVSADGSVVVGYGDSSNGWRALRWAGGTMTDLGTLPGSNYGTIALGVSANGFVVVGYATDNWSYARAFRWAGGTMTNLGTLPDGSGSEANAVSADGSVVVGFAKNADDDSRAFRWAGTMTSLGTLPGDDDSYADGVSADGSVVVGYSKSSDGWRAFIWTAAAGMRDLQQVLVNEYGLGQKLIGWTLWRARAISADGQHIVGYGGDPQGHAQAWVAHLGGAAVVVTVCVDDGNSTGTEDGTPDHPWNTIQEALAVAADGATIGVAKGTYTDTLTISGKSVVIQGGYLGGTYPGTGDFSDASRAPDPATNQTVIDGGGAAWAITCQDAAARGSVLSGVKIRNGRAIFKGGIVLKRVIAKSGQ